MSQLVKRQWTYFELFVSKITNKQRRALLETITSDQLRALEQISNNFLQKTFTVSASDVTKLQRYKHLLRRLADPSVKHSHKRKILKRRVVAIFEFLKTVESVLKTYIK